MLFNIISKIISFYDLLILLLFHSKNKYTYGHNMHAFVYIKNIFQEENLKRKICIFNVFMWESYLKLIIIVGISIKSSEHWLWLIFTMTDFSFANNMHVNMFTLSQDWGVKRKLLFDSAFRRMRISKISTNFIDKN